MSTKALEKGLAGDRALGSSDLGDLSSWGDNLNPDVKAAKAVVLLLEKEGEQIDWFVKKAMKESLGIARIGVKRYESIVSLGVEKGLFLEAEVTHKGKVYPGLVLADAVAEPSRPKAKPKPKAKKAAKKTKAPSPAMTGSGPVILPCGHTQWNRAGSYDHPDQVAARKAGHCCVAAQEAKAKGRTLPVNWRIRGLTHPVPEKMRRGHPDRQGGAGWQGLCCDPETGLYIGGVGNDCRHEGDVRCVAHGKVSLKAS